MSGSGDDNATPDDRDPLLSTAGTDPDLATTADNDAVAGETVLDQAGSGYGGPTGGAPREGEPSYGENDLAHESIDLGDDVPPAQEGDDEES